MEKTKQPYYQRPHGERNLDQASWREFMDEGMMVIGIAVQKFDQDWKTTALILDADLKDHEEEILKAEPSDVNISFVE